MVKELIYTQDTEEEHINVTRIKAGSYFAFPVDLMQLFSRNKTNYSDLAADIGSHYEMIDDYYNLLHPKIDQFGGNPILTEFMDELSFQSYEPPSPVQELYS